MKPILKLWFVILLIKLVIAASLPLFADEAYYWTWSHHLQLSYFDHPGFISWLISLGRPFEGLWFLVRWPAVIFGHIALLFWIALLRPHLNLDQLKAFVLLFAVAPLTGLGMIILTPDLPLLFFWSASLYLSDRALRTGELRWYVLLGAALGLGFCAKYHMVLFIPFVITWLTWSRHWSRINWRGLGLTILMGFVFSLPVIIWNVKNDYISFLFQYQHGLVRDKFNMRWPVEYVWQQAILVFPPLLWGVWRLGFRHLRKMLWSGVSVPLIFFFLASFKGPSEANWPSLAYPAVFALAAMNPTRIWRRFFFGFWLTLTVVVLSEIYHPWIPEPSISQAAQAPRDFARLAQQLVPYSPLYADSYQTAGQISFYSGRQIYKLRGLNRFDQYDLYPQSLPTSEEFYVLTSRPGRPSEITRMNLYEIKEQKPLFADYHLLKVKRK